MRIRDGSATLDRKRTTCQVWRRHVHSLVQRAAASQERINEFLKTQPEIISISKEDYEIHGNIEFKNVSFIYPDSGIKALKNISFKVEQGNHWLCLEVRAAENLPLPIFLPECMMPQMAKFS